MKKIIVPERSIKYVSGTAIPKPESGQTTDSMIHTDYLNEVSFKEMAKYLYYKERFTDNDELIPEHPFNNPAYTGANMVIGGSEFGNGSSREHAAQAFLKYGIEVIIAESLVDIFATNCEKIGVVGVTIPHSELMELAKYIQTNPSTKISLDLEQKTVSYEGNIIKCDIPEGRRQAFLTGTWDAMAVLQQNMDEIEALERNLEYLQFE